jgi:NAD(P)-dependent dehydrogenase (short-subunit alcohol dehydrogenase family)
MSGLDGKVIVVTGAAGGIGGATAQLLVDNGAKVFLVDVDREGLGSVVSSLGDDHAALASADVSQPVDNQRFVQAAVDRFGRIDGAVLNVGIPGGFASIVDGSVENFDRVMNVNVRGTWLGLKYLIPKIAKSGDGSIVLTGSTAGFRAGAPGRSHYVASKHAVIGLMRAAAAECAPLGIRVNSVSPGGVKTQMTESVKDMVGEDEGARILEEFAQTIPLKRLAEPDEIAAVILFLLGNESRYCTATNYMADGGLIG